jgi:hypothetical protein
MSAAQTIPSPSAGPSGKLAPIKFERFEGRARAGVFTPAPIVMYITVNAAHTQFRFFSDVMSEHKCNGGGKIGTDQKFSDAVAHCLTFGDGGVHKTKVSGVFDFNREVRAKVVRDNGSFSEIVFTKMDY